MEDGENGAKRLWREGICETIQNMFPSIKTKNNYINTCISIYIYTHIYIYIYICIYIYIYIYIYTYTCIQYYICIYRYEFTDIWTSCVYPTNPLHDTLHGPTHMEEI